MSTCSSLSKALHRRWTALTTRAEFSRLEASTDCNAAATGRLLIYKDMMT